MLYPAYIIREAQLKDVIHFHQAVCSLTNVKVCINDFESVFYKKIKDKNTKFYLLLTDTKTFAGCIVLYKKIVLSELLNYVELQEFFIVPKYRKLGAAEYFYTQIEKIIKGTNSKLVVNCGINSTLNQNFFTKKGFKVAKKQYAKEL